MESGSSWQIKQVPPEGADGDWRADLNQTLVTLYEHMQAIERRVDRLEFELSEMATGSTSPEDDID